MVLHCCAYGCKETFVKGGAVSFHSFPKDVNRRKLWEIQLRRKDFTVSDSTKICSKHFKAECFDREKFGGTWLKQDAVPTIFSFSNPSLVIKTEKESVKKQVCVAAESSVFQDQDSVQLERLKRKSYLGDFKEEDLTSLSTLKKVLDLAQKKINSQNKIIKSLRQRNRRMERRLSSFKELLHELKSKNLVSASCVLEDMDS